MNPELYRSSMSIQKRIMQNAKWAGNEATSITRAKREFYAELQGRSTKNFELEFIKEAIRKWSLFARTMNPKKELTISRNVEG